MSKNMFAQGRPRARAAKANQDGHNKPSESRGQLRMVELKSLLLLDELQPRVAVDVETIERYQGLMKVGGSKFVVNQRDEPWPEIQVVEGENGELWVVDGFHRSRAAQGAGLAAFQARVWRGSYRSALERSLRANASNGLTRSDDDFERVMKRALADEEWGKFSNRQLSALVGCSHVTVGRWRKRLAGAGELAVQTERKGADGKTYKLKPDAANSTSKRLRQHAPWRIHKKVRSTTFSEASRVLESGEGLGENLLYEVSAAGEAPLDVLERAARGLRVHGTLTVAITGTGEFGNVLHVAGILASQPTLGNPKIYTTGAKWFAIVFPHIDRRSELPEQGLVSFSALLRALGDVTLIDGL